MHYIFLQTSFIYTNILSCQWVRVTGNTYITLICTLLDTCQFIGENTVKSWQ